MNLKAAFQFVTRQLTTFSLSNSPPGWIWNGTTPSPSADPHLFGITQRSDWIEANGRWYLIQTFGEGDLEESIIPEGREFGGRKIGGQGGRARVFGTQLYGSGYPEDDSGSKLGVAGRGFPFLFYPVAYAHTDLPRGIDGPDYLYTEEYGAVNSTDRPGGPLVRLVIESTHARASEDTDPTFLQVIADNSTITALEPVIRKSCNRRNRDYHSYVKPLDGEGQRYTHPASALQYYRGSSAVLLLHPYNNTDLYEEVPSGIPTPLRPYQDLDFINCVNLTIGVAIPLASGVGLDVFSPLGVGGSATQVARTPHFGLIMLLLYLIQWIG